MAACGEGRGAARAASEEAWGTAPAEPGRALPWISSGRRGLGAPRPWLHLEGTQVGRLVSTCSRPSRRGEEGMRWQFFGNTIGEARPEAAIEPHGFKDCWVVMFISLQKQG